MYWTEIFRILHRYLISFSLILLIPTFLAMHDTLYQMNPRDSSCLFGFFFTIGFCLLMAGICKIRSNIKDHGHFFRREAIFIAVCIWVLTPVIGALPYTLSGTLSSFIDALFEATSGFTTTGASNLAAKKMIDGFEVPYIHRSTVIDGLTYTFWGNISPILDQKGQILTEGIEALPRSLLLWRSMTQWLGGMGIIVLFVALTPLAGVGSRVLFQSEVTGPTKEALTPRVAQTASLLWKIYLGLSLIQCVALKIVSPKMHWFDIITLVFSTLSTGGFTIRNQGIAYYDSPYVEWILIIFMTLGGINFSLYYLLLKRKWQGLKNHELLLYLGSLLLSSIFIAFYIYDYENSWLNGKSSLLDYASAFRVSLFHLISSQTSTGFATSNFDIWPFPTQVILLMVMFIGGMSGSTSGGIKLIRHWVLLKFSLYKIRRMIHPQEINQFRLQEAHIDDKTVGFVFVFFFLVISFSALSILVFVLEGIEPESALAITSCLINNVGMSFRLVGPTESFVSLSPIAKIWSCFIMILGRLEFFTLLLILTPGFWKNR